MSFPLGYIEPAARTRVQESAHVAAMNAMLPRFRLTPTAAEPDNTPRLMLRDIWKNPKMTAAVGFEWTGTHQFSGSCVWAGGENVQMTLTAVEVIRLGDAEKIVVPFGLFNYGLSRLRFGDRGEGEGSLGSTYAQSCNEDGTLDTADPDLPDPKLGDGVEWGQREEMRWSAGDAIAEKWKAQAKPRLVRSTAPISAAQDARTALRNWYGITFACNNFINPNGCQIKGTGANACNVGKLESRGGHQTSLLGTWDNPDLGLLFWNQNQWGLKAYETDPATGLGSGCWMPASEVDRALRSLDAEIFAFSQFDGFPAQRIDWSDLYSW